MATKKQTSKKIPETKKDIAEVKEPKKVSVKAKMRFEYYGKIYARGDVLEVLDGNAKSLIDRGFCEKA